MRFLLLMVTLIVSANAVAQKKPQLSVQVVIADRDGDGAKCGIGKSSAESIAALALRNNGIEVVAEETNPGYHLHVTVLKLQSHDSCVFKLGASVAGHRKSDMQNAPLGAFRARQGSITELCDIGYVGIASTQDVGTVILREIENTTKVCLGKLTY